MNIVAIIFAFNTALSIPFESDSLRIQLDMLFTKESPDCVDYGRIGEFIIQSETSNRHLQIIFGSESIRFYDFMDRTVKRIKNSRNHEQTMCINRMLNDVAINIRRNAELSAGIGEYIGKAAQYNFNIFVETLALYDSDQRSKILYKLEFAGSSEIYESILFNIKNYKNDKYAYIIEELTEVMSNILE